MKEIKNKILNEFISNGRLISKKCSEKWFKNNNEIDFLNKIKEFTYFLNNNATIPQRFWHIVNETDYIPECSYKNCHNKLKFYSFIKGYDAEGKCCSVSCSQLYEKTRQKIEKTNLKKYGYTTPLKDRNKQIKALNKKYGKNIINVSQLDYVKNKKKITTREKFGVDWPMQSKDIIEKSKKTCLKKYGVDNIFKYDKVINKTKIIKFKKYYKNYLLDILSDKIQPLFNIEEFDGVGYYNKKFKFKCKKCGNIFEDNLYNKIPRCLNCYPLHSSSIVQEEVFEFIKDLDIKVEKNNRKILNGLELDMYLPDYNLAIELNGIYWHSEIHGNKDKNYHLNKTNLCQEKNIQLLHIFDVEWIYKQEIVKSIIKSKLNIYDTIVYARKCKIKELNYNDTEMFFNKNHLQLSAKSAINYALIFDNKIVSVMSFAKSRFNKNKDEYEIIRFANLKNYKIIGGASKLFKHFIKNNIFNTIVSFADNRYSKGDLYNKLGFKLKYKTTPAYYYFNKKDYKLQNRINYQKHNLKDKLSIFNPNLTEWENMQNNGYDRIWDCGQLKYGYIK